MATALFTLAGLTIGLIVGVSVGSGFIDKYDRYF